MNSAAAFRIMGLRSTNRAAFIHRSRKNNPRHRCIDRFAAASTSIVQQLSNRSRSFVRPRCTRDFMPESDMLALLAAASWIMPSKAIHCSASL